MDGGGGGGAHRGLGGGDVGEPVGVAGPGDAAGGDAAAPPTVSAGGGVPAARAGPGPHGDTAGHGVVAGGLQVGGQRGEALAAAQLHAGGPGPGSHHGLTSVDLDQPSAINKLVCEAVGDIGGHSASLVTSNTGILAA